MAQGIIYPEYGYSFTPNATITSNRCNHINSNIINKNGFIVDNKVSDILFNKSSSICYNTFPSIWYFFPIVRGSIISNDLEGVILNNQIGGEGIKYNTSLDIISNSCYGILNNKTQAIVDNEIERATQPYVTEQIISNNIVNKDIINNVTGPIKNNIIQYSIWNNNLGQGGSDGKIINNKAYSIDNNYI